MSNKPEVALIAKAVKGILLVTMLTFGVANAASFRVTLAQPVVLDGKELKPGEYKVDVKDNTAVLKSGKTSVESHVTTENADRKYDATTVRYSIAGGKYSVQEIRVGGTKTKLVFDSGRSANGGV